MTYPKNRPEDGWPDEMSLKRPYFYYDGQVDGFRYFATEKERDDEAEVAIQRYFSTDGWTEEYINVIAGKVTHITKKCDVIRKPPDSELDEGYDEDGNYFGDYDCLCNYKLFPLCDER
jgi:hypothetical protein